MRLIKLIFLLLLLYVNSLHLYSDTHVPYGDVSGSWNLEGSPYIPDGVITVPVDSILIIEPGVEVIFGLHGRFYIRGTLFCEGTEADSIRFRQPYLQGQQDGALRFVDTYSNLQDSSFVSYCSFDSVGVICEEVNSLIISKSTIKNGIGIDLIDSNPTLTNLFITGNTNDDYQGGGGISCYNSNPMIMNSEITNNNAAIGGNSSANGGGGGVSFTNSSNAILQHVIIEGNTADFGGGVYCEDSSPVLNNCIISNNISDLAGGGAYVTTHEEYNIDLSEISFVDCEISGNISGYTSGWGGSAINLYYSNLIIEKTLLRNNIANASGTINSIGFVNIDIRDTQIVDNTCTGVCGAIQFNSINNFSSEMNLTNCLIARNQARELGAIGAYGGNVTLTNVTITDNVIEESSYIGGIILEHQAELYANNSIIYGNQGAEIFSWGDNEVEIVYSNIEVSDPSVFGVGTISEDPQFINEDYHLAETSPCIDTGTPNHFFNEIEDPHNPGFALYPAMGTIRSDMGAYGGNGYNGYYVGAEDVQIPALSDIQLSNYPNPFNPSTTISFNLTTECTKNTKIEIFNIKGQRIREFKMKNVKLQSGSDGREMNKVTWNGTDQSGNPVASGIYFYKLNVENSPIGKMVLLK